jgi:hypothetical protein
MIRKFKQVWSLKSTKRKTTLTSTLLNTKTTHNMALETKNLAWDRHKNTVGLNWLMGFLPFTFILLDLQRQYIYK